jgi:hypothetical protein
MTISEGWYHGAVGQASPPPRPIVLGYAALTRVKRVDARSKRITKDSDGIASLHKRLVRVDPVPEHRAAKDHRRYSRRRTRQDLVGPGSVLLGILDDRRKVWKDLLRVRRVVWADLV